MSPAAYGQVSSPRGEQAAVTDPDHAPTHDARTGDGDPERDPAAMGERSAADPDGDGGAAPGAQDVPEPGTG